MSIKPALTGNDLRMAGYKPGPLFLEMLAFLHAEYESGQVFGAPHLYDNEQARKDTELFWLRQNGYEPR